MTYYLLLNDSHVSIGEESFGKFWPDDGFKSLYKIMNENPEMLSEITIKTDQNKDLTLTEFIDTLETLKIEKRNV
jgi:hypothetical protein|tara:strand:- start:336 stop:560 length:225 start_codon:yes stop_codon:yes gene_type:complete